MIVKAVAGDWMCWGPVGEPHRCSAAFCSEPGAIYRTGTAHHYDAWPRSRQFRRFLCQKHMEGYGLELRHGRVYYRLGDPRTIEEEHELAEWRRTRQLGGQ